ncbi:DUF5592 family protein [Clostridiales Family XIII bacterium ASD5510]|uniref:DUF5592 family protein n=1 Tax=Hominibacterium faecale TaxID=2839743 RepID=A0A9J6QS09_9FIRM|nr:DUF5592 family protein [Hominibacterium faecale]MCU7378906.1 DUF5592 family protein [Hominibacterium faecale]
MEEPAYETYQIAMEIKSETYFGKGIFLFDLAFIGTYWFFFSNFEFLLHEALVLPYTVLNVLVAFLLTRKSIKNPGKRLYQSLLYAVLASRDGAYHARERSYDEIIYLEEESPQERAERTAETGEGGI